MSRAHVLLPSVEPAASATPNLHEHVPSPPHPYPGWVPEGAGDPTALLAWIDHDLKGHDPVIDAPARARRAEAGESTASDSPVSRGLKWTDRAGTAKDVAESAGWLENPVLQTASKTTSALLAPLEIAGGIMEIMEGAREGGGDGAVRAISGGTGVVSGGAGIASLAVPAALNVSLASLAADVGVNVGNYGDHQVKELDWLHDDEGNPQSVSEWAGGVGRSTRAYFSERGHSTVGSVLGAAATGGASIAGVPIAVAGATTGAGHAIGSGLAHHHLREHYAEITNDPQGLIDYEEQRQAKLDRIHRSDVVFAKFQEQAKGIH